MYLVGLELKADNLVGVNQKGDAVGAKTLFI